MYIIYIVSRLFSIKKINIVISIQKGDKIYKNFEIYPKEFFKNWIRKFCGLFINIIDEKVYLFHQIIKKFLIMLNLPYQLKFNFSFNSIWKKSIFIQSSNFVLAHSCIWYLQLDELYRPEGRAREHVSKTKLAEKYDFYYYAAQNWVQHFRAASIPERHSSIKFGLKLFEISPCQHMSWQRFIIERPWDTTELQNVHLASYLGFTGIVKRLIATSGVGPDPKDKSGRTPLSYAAKGGHLEVVQALLAMPSVEPNPQDRYGQTPLFYAAGGGYLKIIQVLLATPGVELNPQDYIRRTPLSYAAEKGHLEVAQVLRAITNIDLNSKDAFGRTVLSYASENGHLKIVQELITIPNIDPYLEDYEGLTPLSWATGMGHSKIVHALLAIPGVKPNLKDNEA